MFNLFNSAVSSKVLSPLYINVNNYKQLTENALMSYRVTKTGDNDAEGFKGLLFLDY